MTATRERRAFHRRPALENRTVLEWWDGSIFRSNPARVLDISPGGALLSLGVTPPIEAPVWLRMQQPASTSWVGGQVVRVDDLGRLGIRFQESESREFYQAAALGIAFGNILGDDGADST